MTPLAHLMQEKATVIFSTRLFHSKIMPLNFEEYLPMALSEAPRQSANQEQTQPDPKSTQRPPHAEDHETASERLKNEPAPGSADQAQTSADWHPLPPTPHIIAQQTSYARRHA